MIEKPHKQECLGTAFSLVHISRQVIYRIFFVCVFACVDIVLFTGIKWMPARSKSRSGSRPISQLHVNRSADSLEIVVIDLQKFAAEHRTRCIEMPELKINKVFPRNIPLIVN